MKTISISISDLEYSRFGIKKDNLSFTEFVEIISIEINKQNLNKCIQLAEKYNLSEMSLEEINDEIKAVRNAKSDN